MDCWGCGLGKRRLVCGECIMVLCGKRERVWADMGIFWLRVGLEGKGEVLID